MRYTLSAVSLLLGGFLTVACSDRPASDGDRVDPGPIIQLVAEQATMLTSEQQGQPWALLLENDRPPFGVVKLLPLGEHGRLDLVMGCYALYEKLSIIVLHTPEELTLQWATNYGSRTVDESLATIPAGTPPLDSLALEFDLRVQQVTTQLLGFEVFIDGTHPSPGVQRVNCSEE